MTRYVLYAGLIAVAMSATAALAESNTQAKERLQIRQQNMLRSQAQLPPTDASGCDSITVAAKRDQCRTQALTKSTSPLLPVELRDYDQFQRFYK